MTAWPSRIAAIVAAALSSVGSPGLARAQATPTCVMWKAEPHVHVYLRSDAEKFPHYLGTGSGRQCDIVPGAYEVEAGPRHSRLTSSGTTVELGPGDQLELDVNYQRRDGLVAGVIVALVVAEVALVSGLVLAAAEAPNLRESPRLDRPAAILLLGGSATALLAIFPMAMGWDTYVTTEQH